MAVPVAAAIVALVIVAVVVVVVVIVVLVVAVVVPAILLVRVVWVRIVVAAGEKCQFTARWKRKAETLRTIHHSTHRLAVRHGCCGGRCCHSNADHPDSTSRCCRGCRNRHRNRGGPGHGPGHELGLGLDPGPVDIPTWWVWCVSGGRRQQLELWKSNDPRRASEHGEGCNHGATYRISNSWRTLPSRVARSSPWVNKAGTSAGKNG